MSEEVNLYNAVVNGNRTTVKKILASGDVNINQLMETQTLEGNPIKQTALHVASKHGNAEIARLLIAAGADVNLRDSSGATPLHMAAKFARPAACKLLLDNGARVMEPWGTGTRAKKEAPLYPGEVVLTPGDHMTRDLIPNEAVDEAIRAHQNRWFSRQDACGRLIGYEASKYAKSVSKNRGGESGAKSYYKTDQGTRELRYKKQAEYMGTLATAKGFVMYEKLVYNRQRFVAMALKEKFDKHPIGAADIDFDSPFGKLVLAVGAFQQCDFPGPVRGITFPNDGLDVHAKDKNGMTALHRAAQASDNNKVRMLLLRGADVRARDSEGKTALHHAAAKGSDDAVLSLLNWNAPVNASDENGKTPLHEAAAHGQEKVALALLDSGADSGIKDVDGKTAVAVAKSPALGAKIQNTTLRQKLKSAIVDYDRYYRSVKIEKKWFHWGKDRRARQAGKRAYVEKAKAILDKLKPDGTYDGDVREDLDALAKLRGPEDGGTVYKGAEGFEPLVKAVEEAAGQMVATGQPVPGLPYGHGCRGSSCGQRRGAP